MYNQISEPECQAVTLCDCCCHRSRDRLRCLSRPSLLLRCESLLLWEALSELLRCLSVSRPPLLLYDLQHMHKLCTACPSTFTPVVHSNIASVDFQQKFLNIPVPVSVFLSVSAMPPVRLNAFLSFPISGSVSVRIAAASRSFPVLAR